MLDLDYLRVLWNCFYGRVPKDLELESLCQQLSSKVDSSARKELTKLEKSQKAYAERVSLESFVAGFQAAACIAAELREAKRRER